MTEEVKFLFQRFRQSKSKVLRFLVDELGDIKAGRKLAMLYVVEKDDAMDVGWDLNFLKEQTVGWLARQT